MILLQPEKSHIGRAWWRYCAQSLDAMIVFKFGRRDYPRHNTMELLRPGGPHPSLLVLSDQVTAMSAAPQLKAAVSTRSSFSSDHAKICLGRQVLIAKQLGDPC